MVNSFLLIIPVLVIAALSGLYCERAGIINISINGGMIFGALIFSLLGNFTKVSNGIQFIYMLIALLAGGCFSILLGFASITLKGDQIISGTALNILASGIGIFICSMPFSDRGNLDTNFQAIYFDSGQMINIYLIIAILLVIITIFFFNYTKQGLIYTATGDNPNAVNNVGINVIKIRYIAVFISGCLAGLAGALYTFINSGLFSGNVAGEGFIALAIMIFGQWRTIFIAIGAVLFSFLIALGVYLPYTNNASTYIKDNAVIFKAFPFIITLLAMVVFYKLENAPIALGKAFNKSER